MTAKTFALPSLLGGIVPLVKSETVATKSGAVRGTVSVPRVSRVQKVSTSKRALRRSWTVSRSDIKTWATVGLSLTTGVLLLAYIFGINQSAAKGYEIKKQQTKLDQSREENKKLNVRLAEASSLTQIQTEVASHHLVPIANQEYLQYNRLSER